VKGEGWRGDTMGVTDGALCEAWKGTDPHHREVGEEGHACCSHI
jgi:hypothetical protein